MVSKYGCEHIWTSIDFTRATGWPSWESVCIKCKLLGKDYVNSCEHLWYEVAGPGGGSETACRHCGVGKDQLRFYGE